MDPARFIPIADRLSASIGATWASKMLDVSGKILPTWEISVAVLLLASSVHVLLCQTMPGGVPQNILSTVQRLILTVFAQHMFSFTASDTSSPLESIESASYACIVLLTLDAFKGVFPRESYIFMTSAKFMFASVLQGSFETFRDREIFIPVVFLVLVYMIARLFSSKCVVTDALCMMVFDEINTITLGGKWPLQGQFVFVIVLSRDYNFTDPLLEELRQYSRWQVASSVSESLAHMPLLSSSIPLGLVVVSASYMGLHPAVIAIHDVAVLALFNSFLHESSRIVTNMIPGDTLIAFSCSVTLFIVAKSKTERKK